MGKALLPVYVLFDDLTESFNGPTGKDYEFGLRQSLSDMSKQIILPVPVDVEINYTLMHMQISGPLVSSGNISLNFTVDMKSALGRILFECEVKRNTYSVVNPYIFVLFNKYVPQSPPMGKNWFKDKDSEWDKLSKTFDAEIEFFASKKLKKGNFDDRLPFPAKNLDLNSLSMLFGLGAQSMLKQKLKKISSANKLPQTSLAKNVQQGVPQNTATPSPSLGTGPLPSRPEPAPALPLNKQSSANANQNLSQSNLPIPSESPASTNGTAESKEQPPAPPKPEFKPTPPAEWQIVEPPSELGDRTSHTSNDTRDVDGKWYICGASRRGKLHENEATFREDAFQVDAVGGWILVAVADGAGSHHLSRVGSNLAVKKAIETMTETVTGKPPIEEVVQSALQKALKASWIALSQETERRKSDKVEFRDLSTTLLLLMYYPKKELVGVAQIGDGLIAAQLEDGRVALLGHPESGEYSGQTYFLTNHKVEELPSKCDTPLPPGPVKYFFVMTDGVADDLYPPQERLPGLIKAIPEVMANQFPDKALLELINYNRPGSFDDRTLVIVCKREDICAEFKPSDTISKQSQTGESKEASANPSAGVAQTESEAQPPKVSENKDGNAGKIEQTVAQTPDTSRQTAESAGGIRVPPDQSENIDSAGNLQTSH